MYIHWYYNTLLSITECNKYLPNFYGMHHIKLGKIFWRIMKSCNPLNMWTWRDAERANSRTWSSLYYKLQKTPNMPLRCPKRRFIFWETQSNALFSRLSHGFCWQWGELARIKLSQPSEFPTGLWNAVFLKNPT